MKLVEGNYYETVSGVIVGPMVEHDKGTTMPHFSSRGNELKALNCEGEELEGYQLWESNGKVFAGVPAEDCHVIAREVAAPSSVETLTIKIDAKEAQELIESAAKEFDASAHKLLSEMAGVQKELRAAKKAFNILHNEKRDLRRRFENQRETIINRGVEIKSLTDKLADKEDVIYAKTDRLKRSLELVKSANARNIALSKKNEALGMEVLRLSETSHECRVEYSNLVARIVKGENRLRRDRAKLKAERARAALLRDRAKDAEDQLRMYSSGKIVARNSAILLGLLATAFAFGGIFF